MRDIKELLGNRTRRKTAAFINDIFQITHFFQCSQRYTVLHFWNTKNLNILFKLSISWVSNKMDTSCKLLADETIGNPWCHWALHHQLNYDEPTSVKLKYLIKWPASVVFNSSPKFLDTVFRWKKKKNSKSSNEHSSLFKENLSKLKTRFRHFQFFPLVLNHIT